MSGKWEDNVTRENKKINENKDQLGKTVDIGKTGTILIIWKLRKLGNAWKI